MTNRCKYLGQHMTVINGERHVSCIANVEQCPKNRLKCHVGQSCWQIKGYLRNSDAK